MVIFHSFLYVYQISAISGTSSSALEASPGTQLPGRRADEIFERRSTVEIFTIRETYPAW
jgi:hypothetical protein